ncbi:hypothetical protein KVC60_01050 [Helicobacter pylori]|uniref:hypothetical protein n=1 Tax=Helicobacter pylori TaxID=210 RepID=UPI00165AE91F|nr:hypothetical protein [Helicobacter pylori]WQS05096.1 hypothetical protein KVD72_01025 [Helicobacter pylori]WQS20937.1 hypothetical protein KVC60_01050 [Helicobacter pylori]WQS30279.1 hypothetical protein KVE56_01050 [Helicobacter pylori]
MKRLALVLVLALGVMWGRSLPKWAKECSKEVEIQDLQTNQAQEGKSVVEGKILVCGASEVLPLDMDYSLSSARHNALEKVLKAFNGDKIEITASQLKATFIGADKVYVLIEVDKKNIALINKEQ